LELLRRIGYFAFFIKYKKNPRIIVIIRIMKEHEKKIDTIIEVMKLGELIPIIPKMGHNGATIIKRA